MWRLIAAVLICLAARAQNDFRFAIVGDRTGGANSVIYERIWRQIGTFRPHFAINVGDTIEGGDEEKAESEWRALRPIWRRHGFPFYFTPGNHDIWSERSLKIYEKETGRPRNYSFDFQNAHFTVLDNSRTLELGEDQLKFLEEDLKANQGRSPKFIFFHKPYWIGFLKLGSGEFPLHRIAKQYGAGHIVNGHAHAFFRMTRDGIAYLAVGSSGGRLRGTEYYHFIEGVVKGERVELTLNELDPPAGKGRRVRVEQWK